MSTIENTDDQSFQAEVREADGVVLVDFWAPWCGPCKAMGPTVDQLAEEMGDQLKVVKHNTQDDPQSATELGVMAIPCFIVFKGGEEVARHSGPMDLGDFKKFVEPHL